MHIARVPSASIHRRSYTGCPGIINNIRRVTAVVLEAIAAFVAGYVRHKSSFHVIV